MSSGPPYLPPPPPIHPRTTAAIGPVYPVAVRQLSHIGPHAFPPPALLHEPYSRSLPPPSTLAPLRAAPPPLFRRPLSYTFPVEPERSPQHHEPSTEWSPQIQLPARVPLGRVFYPTLYSAPHPRSPYSPSERMQNSPGGILGPETPHVQPQATWQPALNYREWPGRLQGIEEGRFPARSPISPINSTPRSSTSSYHSPRRPPERSAARSAFPNGPNSGLSVTSAPPARHGTVPTSHVAPQIRAQKDSANRYKLIIRQQPVAARACGQGERDRRTIDPPPILQLLLTDFDADSADDMAKLRWPTNIVHCALHSIPQQPLDRGAVGQDVSTITDQNNAGRQSRRLMGTLVANPFIGVDPEAPPSDKENSRIGCFFIFHDLSCRQNGLYRLHFTLVSVNVESLVRGAVSPTIATVESDVFEVFSAKDFPGMRASSALTKSLKGQGANVQVKKGSEGKGKKRTVTESEHSGSEGTDNEESSTRSKKRKRNP